MLRHLLTIAIRNILKHFNYSILNIVGLAIGIFSFLFILIYVSDELKYDRFHENQERIYRINRVYDSNDIHEDAATVSFPLLEGDPASVLNRPNTIVLTESTAKKYFGDTPAIGKTLRMEEQIVFEVTGIMKDLPEQTQFKIDMLASLSTFRIRRSPSIFSLLQIFTCNLIMIMRCIPMASSPISGSSPLSASLCLSWPASTL